MLAVTNMKNNFLFIDGNVFIFILLSGRLEKYFPTPHTIMAARAYQQVHPA
ncbi:MAG: hypothetical protein SCH39_07745 [Methanosarcinales archaeon]|nr:hypothetical protein [Methanosarcinales archaeon]